MLSPGRKVTIIQEQLPHYRLPFFNLLRNELASKGCTLELVYGMRADSRLLGSTLDWATAVPLRKLGPFLWHQLENPAK